MKASKDKYFSTDLFYREFSKNDDATMFFVVKEQQKLF